MDSRVVFYGAVALAGLYLLTKLDGAAKAVGQGIKAADDVAAGAVGGIGKAVGLPTPSQTIDDAATVRRIWDEQGWFEASKQGTAAAFFKAAGMPSFNVDQTPIYSSGQGTATRVDNPGTFAGGAAGGGDPFALGNYGTGSIWDVPSTVQAPGAGEIYGPSFSGSLGRGVF